MSIQDEVDDDVIERFFLTLRKSLGSQAEKRWRHTMSFHYKHIDFTGRRVLDIGGGNGIHSFYAHACGAARVVNLEPEYDGSTSGMQDQFHNWKAALGATCVDIIDTTFQEYSGDGMPFDVILIQDAINHLDESACISLKESEASQDVFRRIFAKLGKLSSSGGVLHIADCSSQNFYPRMRLGNPFDSEIEWRKHQPPSLWQTMLEEAGYKLERKRWSSPGRFGPAGQALFGNSLAAYFFTSHFAMTLRKI
ncbi:MAG: hypothetical protein JXQ99_02685 [Hyphomicrobiaceae bacterium]